MTFDERLAKYKEETDYFAVDIFKGGREPYETKHDLTWAEAQKIVARAKKNKHISRIDIVVEDWDAEDDFLYKEVESIEKEPCAWKCNLDDVLTGGDMFSHPIEWK